MNAPTIIQSFNLAKSQLAAYMADGTVPRTVKSFSELHDYIDANCLGGFCDDDISEALIVAYGGRDVDEGMPDGMLAHINTVQELLNAVL
jgi:hypothetical protein